MFQDTTQDQMLNHGFRQSQLYIYVEELPTNYRTLLSTVVRLYLKNRLHEVIHLHQEYVRSFFSLDHAYQKHKQSEDVLRVWEYLDRLGLLHLQPKI